MKIIDISPEISADLPVWPGDTKFSASTTATYPDVNFHLSSITTTVHLGAHTDAPVHYSPHAIGMSERSLNYYFGPAQVISVKISAGERIFPKDLGPVKIQSPRVLFKTKSFPHQGPWKNDFNSLSPDLISYLKTQAVVLVGIDTPSIDPWDDKDLHSHQKIHELDMAILEGIDLDQVSDGNYVLAALPLKMKGLDASPVRAVLIEGENWNKF